MFAGISNNDCSKIKIEALKVYAEAVRYENENDTDNALLQYKKAFTLWPGVGEVVTAFWRNKRNVMDMDDEIKMNSKKKCILRMIQKLSETSGK